MTAARVADRAFGLSAREAANGLADLRVSQLAYVAAGTEVSLRPADNAAALLAGAPR